MPESFPRDGVTVTVVPLTRRQRLIRRTVGVVLLLLALGPLIPVVFLVTDAIARDGWARPARPITLITLLVLWVAVVGVAGFVIVRLARRDRDRTLRISPAGLTWRWRGRTGQARWDEIRDVELAQAAHRPRPVLCLTPHADASASISQRGAVERLERHLVGAPVTFDLMHLTDIDIAAAVLHYSGRTVRTR